MSETTVSRLDFQPVSAETAANQRFEMRMSPQLMNGLEIMAAREATGKADVIRRALGLYALALEAESKGQLIGFACLRDNAPPEVTRFIKLHSTGNLSNSNGKDISGYERFEMRTSPELIERLNGMANTENTGKADVVRRALGLYALALEAESKGQSIMFANLNKGNKIEVVRLIMLR